MKCFIKPYVKKQLLVAICVYIGILILSLLKAYPNPYTLSDPDGTPLPSPLSAEERTLIELTFYCGVWIGALIFGFLSNIVGRKPCFFLGGAICLCTFVLLANLKTIEVLYVVKLTSGLGTGILYVGILVYLGEIASTNIRGLILTIIHLFGGLQPWIDIFNDSHFYTLSYYGLAISAVFIMAMFYIPESPVFFTFKGNKENLERSLTFLGRENELTPMLSTQLELTNHKKTHTDNWLEIFKVRSNRNALFVILGLNMLQGLSGSMSVLYYTPQIIYPAEVLSVRFASTLMMLNSTCGILVAIALIENVGRKKLLMISTASCALSLAILSTYLLIDMWLPNHNAWVYVICIILSNYFFSYSMGFSIIPETLIGEMFTPNVRGTGSAIVIFTSTFVEFSIKLIIHQVPNLNLGIVFVVYCLSNVAAFFFTLFLVPETKNMTLSHINVMLKEKKLIRYS